MSEAMMRAFWSVPFLCLVVSAAGAETPLVDSNSWAFDLPADAFTEDALLDLRYLNEPRSGQSGFIGLSDDRNSFVRGDGKPIRFWMKVLG